MFYVGQKVVCIAAGTWKGCRARGLSVPVKNGIYTIRELTFYSDMPGLRLEEIRNPPVYNDDVPFPAEVAWWRDEFRPVVKSKPDISVFLKILNKEYV